MNTGANIEFHHVFPRARVQGTYANEEWNSLATLAFVTGQTNKMISARMPSQYMAEIASERVAEQWIPEEPELWSLDRFPDFLAARRRCWPTASTSCWRFLATTYRPPTGTPTSCLPTRS